MQSVLAAGRALARPAARLGARNFAAPRAASLRAPVAIPRAHARCFSASAEQTVEKGDQVSIHYVGTLEDGEQFDSSRHGFGGEPFEFTLGEGQVIRGWDEGFATMKPGERALLTIKAEYAYGDAGSRSGSSCWPIQAYSRMHGAMAASACDTGSSAATCRRKSV